ncbi:MAG: CDP-alcohol phosphatidyltransferase family protein [Gemmataceae bacterium]|nr:CDP-alcohol phosphatidyltransferase family protein [Gemmataceae bacterium]
MPAPPDPPPSQRLLNVPNLLSLSRLPLAAVLFGCVAYEAWLAGLCVFSLATFTDWADGWWARRYGPLTAVGRNLDPLTDKVLVCGLFIYLIPVPGAGIEPWMVTLVVGRELLVTGLRGVVEATGRAFGADWFGKLKMVLQCAVLVGVLLLRWLHTVPDAAEAASAIEGVQVVLLWLMLTATAGSGVQYVVKAARLLK